MSDMQHDLHHIYCDCILVEYGGECGEVVAACRRLTQPTCSICGARIMIRALECVSDLTSLFDPIGYRSSQPLPVGTFLAGLNAEMN